MSINRNNYEVFFMDYLDGNLSPSEEEQLWIFLRQNPDLKLELESFENVPLPDSFAPFPSKSALQRTSLSGSHQDSNFDDLCIGYLEGDLNPGEKAAFEEFLEVQPQRKREFQRYLQVRLKADQSVTFPHKQRLKKTGFVLGLKTVFPYLAAAASLVLIIALYLLVPGSQESRNKNQITHFERNPLQIEPVEKEIEIQEPAKEFKNQPMAQMQKDPVPKEKKKPASDPADRVMLKDLHPLTAMQALPVEPFDQKQLAYSLAKTHTSSPDKIMDGNSSFNRSEDDYQKITSYIAESVQEKIWKNTDEEQQEFELFDIARWAVGGINRLTGSNMTLEKKYNQQGVAEKINFNSKLIAFSAPLKEK
ncbi:MAG: hypothetical protein V2I54_08720 [Bacteroidales bacterium]|nr:hypothetical protein [Bacteroidales bacterium]